NIIHGSDSTESAQREVKLWFTSSEIADYKEPREDWLYE
ncbi:MAG: nucleoside-diphosphate kinase, partial [Staphylococcus epidermidis]|nr:nucleoside-diphosphate kinase [Staphylococcus epidermidis]